MELALSADAVLNATTALFVGLLATVAAIGIAIYQRHNDKQAARDVAAERKRADDAVARLEAVRAEEVARLVKENSELRGEHRRDYHHDV